MLVSRGEIFNAIVYRRLENSNIYEETPSIVFKCRVANQKEKSNYQSASGLITQNEGLYLFATRLPSEVRPDDKIIFMGNEYLVESVGEYVSNARFLSGSINYANMQKSFPKGLKIV